MAGKDRLGLALGRAAVDPSLMPDFYRFLLDSSVWMFVPESAGRSVQEKGTLPIVQWRDALTGLAFVPLFSSEETFPEKIPPEFRPLRIRALDLFKAVRGIDFRLNPASRPTLDLPSDFVDTLVRDSAGHHGVHADSLAAGAVVRVGPPSVNTAVFAASLRTLFGRRKRVPAVYLFDLHNDTDPDRSHVLAVGLVAPYEVAIGQDISAMLPEAYDDVLPLSIVFMEPGDSIFEALRQQGISPVVDPDSDAPWPPSAG